MTSSMPPVTTFSTCRRKFVQAPLFGTAVCANESAWRQQHRSHRHSHNRGARLYLGGLGRHVADDSWNLARSHEAEHVCGAVAHSDQEDAEKRSGVQDERPPQQEASETSYHHKEEVLHHEA